VSPVVIITGAFASGIAIAEYYSIYFAPAMTLAAAFLFLAASIWFYLKGKRHSFCFSALFFIALGCSWIGLEKVPAQQHLEPLLGHYVRMEGIAVSGPAYYPNRFVLVLENPVLEMGEVSWKGSGKFQVVYYTKPQEAACSILPGDKVKAEGFLELPPAALGQGEFDYRAYLVRHGILAQLKAQHPPQVVAGGRGGCYLLRKLPASWRFRIAEGIKETLPSEQALFLEGLLLGSREGITPDDRENYQRAGVMHLFAVSGLHLGFVFVLVLVVAGALRLSNYTTFLLAASAVWGYAALIDFAPPVTRAAVMATVGLGAHFCQLRKDAVTSLALAALAILLWEPAALFEPGFQISFAATWGIIYLTDPVGKHLPLPEWLREMVVVPLVAQLAVLPFTAFYFQQITVLGLAANILVVPLAGLAVYLGLIGAVFTILIPGVGSPFLICAGALSFPIKGIAELLAAVPGAVYPVPRFPWYLAVVWFVLLYLLGWSLREGFTVSFPHFRFRSLPSRWLVPSLCGLVLCLILICWGGGYRTQQLEVIFINVGQGDAILVRAPNGRTMLVDAGGSPSFGNSSFDPGREIVLPTLWGAGIRRLDLVVNSHPHEDHLGGVPAVLRNMKVGGFVTPPLEHPTPLSLQVESLLDQKKIPVYRLQAGARIELDPALKIAVLGPPEQLYSGTRSDLNNNSLVLHITCGEISFLLTGDLEGEGMAGLAAAARDGLIQGGLASTVLKAPHHGSGHSINPEFAAAVRPRVVVVSVGRNSFGHPAPALLHFWQEQGAQVLRTDEEGTIIFKTDGKRLEIIDHSISHQKRSRSSVQPGQADYLALHWRSAGWLPLEVL